MTDDNLQWGADDLLPDGVRCAWGARLIITQDGTVDLLPDRQGFAGGVDGEPEHPALDPFVNELNDWLNGGALKKAIENLREMLRNGQVDTRKPSPVMCYWPADNSGMVVGDTNASGGYFYMAAFLCDHLPEGHATRGAEKVIEAQQALKEAAQ